MILYHGSNTKFDKIDLNRSKPNKDFGRGFYLSDNYAQAMELAVSKTEQLKTGSPVVMEYELDEQLLVDSNLKVKRFDDYSKEWALFILANRNNKSSVPVHDYDIVVGPIANDRVGVQLWKYESQMIDIDMLVHNLQFMKGVTIQYFFGTERSIQHLKRL